MSPDTTPSETNPGAEPAHPAPPRSPRPLGSDGLPQKRDPARDRKRWGQSRQESAESEFED